MRLICVLLALTLCGAPAFAQEGAAPPAPLPQTIAFPWRMLIATLASFAVCCIVPTPEDRDGC